MALYPRNPTTEFARAVAKGTGLDFEVVLGWVQAEGGAKRPNNPLNIGGVKGPDYGSPDKAAAATVALLHTSRYAPVLKAARTGDRNAQINAIAHSPWDQCNYQGWKRDASGDVVCLKNPPGTKLVGAINAITGLELKPPGATIHTPLEDIPDIGKGVGVQDLPGAVGGWVGGLTSWIGESVALALAYVVLTLAAAALFVLGVMRTAGTSPGELAKTVAQRRAGSVFPEGY